MELREWLIILGLGLVTIIVLDGVRRFQRQRNVPRLDQIDGERGRVADDPVAGDPAKGAADRDKVKSAANKSAASKSAADKDYDATIDWELPNGGARVLKSAQQDDVPAKPKLVRQEHPGPSRVLSEFRQRQREQGINDDSSSQQPPGQASRPAARATSQVPYADEPVDDSALADDHAISAQAQESVNVGNVAASSDESGGRREPALTLPEDQPLDDHQPLAEHGEAARFAADSVADSDSLDSDSLDSDSMAPPNVPHADGEADSETDESETAETDDTSAKEASTKREPHDSLYADPEDHDAYDDEDYRLVDLEGMGDSLKTNSRRVGTSVHRFGTSLQRSMSERRKQRRLERKQRQAEKQEKARLKAEQQAAERERRRQQDEARAVQDAERREQEARARALREEKHAALRASHASERAESERLEERGRAQQAASKAKHEAALSESLQAEYEALYGAAADDNHEYDDSTGHDAALSDMQQTADQQDVPQHPVLEKTLRTAIESEHARDTLGEADEVIIISVMSRDKAGFSGATLLNLMLACGLRYAGDMGIFHRFETEELTSNLQFSMVNAVKPGTFPVREMDDFSTPGVTLLMPLPGAEDTSAAFEAMVETAMVIVRHLGGELKDENQSVMTAQTVEFARQRVQEFERRHRLRRYQVN